MKLHLPVIVALLGGQSLLWDTVFTSGTQMEALPYPPNSPPDIPSRDGKGIYNCLINRTNCILPYYPSSKGVHGICECPSGDIYRAAATMESDDSLRINCHGGNAYHIPQAPGSGDDGQSVVTLEVTDNNPTSAVICNPYAKPGQSPIDASCSTTESQKIKFGNYPMRIYVGESAKLWYVPSQVPDTLGRLDLSLDYAPRFDQPICEHKVVGSDSVTFYFKYNREAVGLGESKIPFSSFDSNRFSEAYVVSKYEIRIVDGTDGKRVVLFYLGATTSNSKECGEGLIELTKTDEFDHDSDALRSLGEQGYTEFTVPVVRVAHDCGDYFGLTSESISTISLQNLMISDFAIPDQATVAAEGLSCECPSGQTHAVGGADEYPGTEPYSIGGSYPLYSTRQKASENSQIGRSDVYSAADGTVHYMPRTNAKHHGTYGRPISPICHFGKAIGNTTVTELDKTTKARIHYELFTEQEAIHNRGVFNHNTHSDGLSSQSTLHSEGAMCVTSTGHFGQQGFTTGDYYVNTGDRLGPGSSAKLAGLVIQGAGPAKGPDKYPTGVKVWSFTGSWNAISTPLEGMSAMQYELHSLSHTSYPDATEYVFFDTPVDLQGNPWLLLRMPWSGDTPCARFGFLLCEDGPKTKYQYKAPSDYGYGWCVDESGSDGAQSKIRTYQTDVFNAERQCDKDPHCLAFSYYSHFTTFYTDAVKSRDLYPTNAVVEVVGNPWITKSTTFGHAFSPSKPAPDSISWVIDYQCYVKQRDAPTIEVTTDCSKSFQSQMVPSSTTGSTDVVWCSAAAQDRKEKVDAKEMAELNFNY